MRALPLLFFALSLLPGLAHAQQAHEAEMREIARILACPVCQGLSVADSPSQLAGQMRETILAKLQAGETREEVIQYFVGRYGESILFDPPKSGFALIVWWGPVLAVVGGAAVVGASLWRWLRRPRPDQGIALDPDEISAYRAQIETELARRARGGP